MFIREPQRALLQLAMNLYLSVQVENKILDNYLSISLKKYAFNIVYHDLLRFSCC